MFKTADIVVEGQKKHQIIVPGGGLEAPGDHQVVQRRVDFFGDGIREYYLIKQLASGNCAEYTALNVAIILRELGFAINPAVQEYLGIQIDYGLNSLERDLVLPLLLEGIDCSKSLKFQASDTDNLQIKYQNPYEPLSIANSLLLFRMITLPKFIDFKPDEFLHTSQDPQNFINNLKCHEITSVFVGSQAHATAYLKFGDRVYYVDPFTDQIVNKRSIDEMYAHINRLREQSGSVVSLNELRTN